jgi:hypothetical protein
MDLILVRFSYAPTETEGLFYAPPLEPFATMEQPWVGQWGGATYPSGKPFYSCIPEGKYELVPYKRPNGQKVWALVNASLGVYLHKVDRKHDHERYLCLMHPGNLVEHTQGCILPGLRRGIIKGQRAVVKSGFRAGYAMDLLAKLLGPMSTGHTLTIRQVKGAHYV